MKGDWLNTIKVVNPDIEKPCIKLRYCPYGQLIEEFPFSPERLERKGYSKLSCADVNGSLTQFGHDCPVHYLAEYLCINENKKGCLCP